MRKILEKLIVCCVYIVCLVIGFVWFLVELLLFCIDGWVCVRNISIVVISEVVDKVYRLFWMELVFCFRQLKVVGVKKLFKLFSELINVSIVVVICVFRQVCGMGQNKDEVVLKLMFVKYIVMKLIIGLVEVEIVMLMVEIISVVVIQNCGFLQCVVSMVKIYIVVIVMIYGIELNRLIWKLLKWFIFLMMVGSQKVVLQMVSWMVKQIRQNSMICGLCNKFSVEMCGG